MRTARLLKMTWNGSCYVISSGTLRAAALTIALCASLGVSPATAAQTEWHRIPIGGKLRLIGGEVLNGASAPRIMVGIQIEMEPGWKTYWRSPGDGGGVPPTVTWEDSRNIMSGRMLYPAPERFRDAEGDSIGYHDSALLLLELTPEQAEQPIELAAGLFVGICKDICVPVETTLELTLQPGERPTAEAAMLLQRALLAVPPAEVEGAAPAPEGKPAIGTVSAVFDDAKPRIEVAAVLPAGATKADLFVEAADGSFVPLPDPVASITAGPTTFRIDLSRAQRPHSLKGKPLILTLVTDQGSIEARRALPN
jgi:DsbC/DsbD-like thiol-disulfide interchange protein